MAKVRIASLGKKAARAAKSNKSLVHTKRMRGPKGKQVKLFVVDSNDDNFDDELTHVFSLNIGRARQANTALFGSPDGPVKFAGKPHKTAEKSK